MKYLRENDTEADTYFNRWPVPLIPVSQMPKLSMAAHDSIFKNDVPEDECVDDGSGAAMLTELGDNVVPFPNELPTELDARVYVRFWY